MAKAFLANVTFLFGIGSDLSTNAMAVVPLQRKTLKRAVGSATTSGDNTAIAAVGGKCLKVYAYALQGVGTVNNKFTDGAAGTQLSMLWILQAREHTEPAAVAPPNYLFKTTAGNALILNCSSTAGCGFEISYWDDDGV